MSRCRMAIAAILIAAPLGSAESASDEIARQGRALVKESCERCHSIDVTGESAHKDAPPFRTFASKWPLESLEEALAEGIVTGHEDMPAFVFEPEQIDAIIEFLHTLAEDAKPKQ